MENNKGNVPFSWEDQPGISKMKVVGDSRPRPSAAKTSKLPLPPSGSSRRVSLHEMLIPLPPCPFQPPPQQQPTRSASKKGAKNEDDPFLAAFRQCTKNTKELGKTAERKGVRSGLRKHGFSLSCKRSCSVMDGNFVRISHSES